MDVEKLTPSTNRAWNRTSSRTRILVVGPSPHEIGGMATVVGQILNLASEHKSGRGVEDNQEEDIQQEEPGRSDERSIKTSLAMRYEIEHWPVTHRPLENEWFAKRCMRHLRHLVALRSRIRATSTTIVHIHTCSGFSFYRSVMDLLIARECGCRSILHIHGAGFDDFFDAQPRWRQWIITRSLTQADRVVALSTGWRERLQRMAPALSPVVIENAVELAPSTESASDEHPCRFLFLAKLDQWKGVDDLLKAAGELRRREVPYELVLAGPAGSAGSIVSLNRRIRADGLAGCVSLVGSVQGDKKSELFDWADVLVQPSHQEGMPLSILEAFAHRLPVIATKVGSIPEVIEDGRHGLLIDTKQPTMLAAAMAALATNQERRLRIGQTAGELARQRFSIHRLEGDLMDLYDELCGEARSNVGGQRSQGLNIRLLTFDG